MSEAALEFVKNLLRSIGIHYEFMEWTETPKPDCYFTGEYIEDPSETMEENGHQIATFILRGYTRKEWALLEKEKAKIKANVATTAILDDGSGIAVSYHSANNVHTNDMALKSIKINLTIQEWKVI